MIPCTRCCLFICRSGLHTIPHNAKIHYNYANFLKDDGRVSEAITHYKKAVMLVECVVINCIN